jgi:uncharacterized repeat protein (TIGR03837 family)
MSVPQRWDIFCRVVDYFGDAGVCWRLARQLACEHGVGVRLCIDDLPSLRQLEPRVTAAPSQHVDGIEVVEWTSHSPSIRERADVSIDAFGCGLPQAYVDQMNRADEAWLWIVLEYLSAESWVAAHHGLPSPHPSFPARRFFFFPGFVEGTGGLLRERDLFVRRDAFDESRREEFWTSLGHPPVPPDAFAISVFGYANAPLTELLQCWEHSPTSIVVAIPDQPLTGRALDYFGVTAFPRERVMRRGRLEVRFLPFVAQSRYDELLWSCDCNFVRGEDSFVRAQWAGRSFVWQPYAQPATAHEAKLEAFLRLYCEDMAAPARASVVNLMHFWNQVDPSRVSARPTWSDFVAHREAIGSHTRRWASRIATVGSLSSNLASFCRDKLK